MFEQHAEFDQPNDEEILWRYQDIPRYLDLLLKQKLFFNRADRFEDPFEGRISKESKKEIYKSIRRKVTHAIPEESGSLAEQEIKRLSRKHNIKRRSVTINSWHSNKNENYAMWNIYAKGTYGVAMQTTFKRLRDSFSATDKPVFIGKVKYSENAESICYGESLIPFLCKRPIYEYENEVRCCYIIDEDKEDNLCWEEQGIYNGVFIKADLNTLIERIYISPYSPKWIREIITGINEKFDLDKEIVHSSVFDSRDY